MEETEGGVVVTMEMIEENGCDHAEVRGAF